jgi:hypothetical protein
MFMLPFHYIPYINLSSTVYIHSWASLNKNLTALSINGSTMTSVRGLLNVNELNVFKTLTR